MESLEMKTTMEKGSVSPCIFGVQIKDVCPVLQIITANRESLKYIKESNEFLDVLKQGLETVTSHFAQVHYFCAICPFLSQFKEQK